MKNDKVSEYYDKNYFNWQSSLGSFGGWANKSKFANYIKREDVVLDFGCGGGYLLKNIDCKEKIGVEINPDAIKIAQENGLKVFSDTDEVPDDSMDVIISDNALEHTLRPLDELKSLYKKLKKGGKIIFVVPCEAITLKYKPNDINHHLYSWSPLSIGNLFTEAGFSIVESKAYFHKWPPFSRFLARIFGRWLFEVGCRIYGRIERSWFQIRVVGVKS